MNEYLISEEEKRTIRSLFNVTDSEIKVKVKMLQEWINDQSDTLLKSNIDETFLNLMLLRGKFRDEIVKKNITNYFKHIGRYPEYFTGLNKLKPSEEVGIAILSPKLTPNWERVVILKFCPTKQVKDKSDIHRCILIGLATALIAFANDYAAAYRLILDFDVITIKHVSLLNISDLFKVLNIYENVLKMRIGGIELVNAPHVLSILLNLAKIILKPKLFSRINVHKNMESLHKNIPKQCLPSDYDGELESIQELVDKWDHIYQLQQPLFDNIEDLVKNSSSNNNNDDNFAVCGSFKKLSVD